MRRKKKLKMETDARLLANLIYLNYEHLNGKFINVKPTYKMLNDIVNYTNIDKEKIKKACFYLFKS